MQSDQDQIPTVGSESADVSELFHVVSQRFGVNGPRLRQLRERRGLSMREFASRCGWSHAWQGRMERDSLVVNSHTVKTIIGNLKVAQNK